MGHFQQNFEIFVMQIKTSLKIKCMVKHALSYFQTNEMERQTLLDITQNKTRK